MKTWPTKKLGEVCDFEGGRQPPKSVFKYEPQKGYVRLLQIRDFVSDAKATYIPDSSKLRKCIVDDVLIGRYGASVGKVLRGKAGAYNVAIIKTIPNEQRLLKDYLFIFLQSPYVQERFTNFTKRAAQAGYTKEEIGSIKILLPPIVEQRKIVEKIEGLFAKIDEASRLCDESSVASTALLPSALHHIFSLTEKEGWEEKTLEDVAEINPSKKEIVGLRPDTEVSFVPMSAVSETTQSIERQEERKLEEVKKGYTYFREGDVLFAKITPCMENGKIIIAEKLKNEIGFGSTEFHVLRAKEMVLPAWLFYFLWNPEFRKEAEKNMTGTAGQQRVPADYLKKSKIPLPSIPEQKKIVAHLNALSEKSRALQELQKQTADDLSSLKQSVLSKLFNEGI